MDEPKPVTEWARWSLVCSLNGWLGVLIYRVPEAVRRGATLMDFGSSVLIVGSLAYLMCLAGTVAGVLALVRIRGDGYRGHRQAWAGLVLGGLPVLAGLGLQVWNLPRLLGARH